MGPLKILFLPNWRVYKLGRDKIEIPSPNKILSPNSYWFFSNWNDIDFEITVIDNYCFKPLQFIEKKLSISILQSIKAFFIQNKYDIIVSHGSTSSILFLFLNTILRTKKKPFLLIDVGCFNRARENKFELYFIKIAVKSIDFIIYHSSIQKKWYEKHLPFLVNKTKFIPFGVDDKEFKPKKLNRKNKYILAFGPPGRGRDYITLLESWAKITNNVYKLIIVGPENLDYLGYGKLPSDIVVKGLVDIKELKEYIINSSFVVLPLPYYEHSYGQMSFLQTMACGKAVITTKTPSTIDYITDENGVLVECKNVEDLAKNIKYLIEQPDEAERIGKNARRCIEEKFNEKMMAKEIGLIIKGIINAR